MEVGLDITADHTPEGPDEVVHLSGVGTSNSVGHTDSVDTDLVDRAVDRQQVDELGSERVFGRESDLDTLGLDEFNDLDRATGKSAWTLAFTRPFAIHNATHVLVIQVMSLPCECSRRKDEVPMTTSTPSTPAPVSVAYTE